MLEIPFAKGMVVVKVLDVKLIIHGHLVLRLIMTVATDTTQYTFTSHSPITLQVAAMFTRH
jgi:hypothetical protein